MTIISLFAKYKIRKAIKTLTLFIVHVVVVVFVVVVVQLCLLRRSFSSAKKIDDLMSPDDRLR
jgi:cytochrome c-type biogenesis protein CcmH/NrfF